MRPTRIAAWRGWLARWRPFWRRSPADPTPRDVQILGRQVHYRDLTDDERPPRPRSPRRWPGWVEGHRANRWRW